MINIFYFMQKKTAKPFFIHHDLKLLFSETDSLL